VTDPQVDRPVAPPNVHEAEVAAVVRVHPDKSPFGRVLVLAMSVGIAVGIFVSPHTGGKGAEIGFEAGALVIAAAGAFWAARALATDSSKENG
jgi:hypothetical protein